MSAPTFTPGPWRHAAVEGGWDGVESEQGLICKLSLNVPANARLIAAAPELLAALQEITTLFGRPFHPSAEKAVAAISKATGQEETKV